MIYSTVKHLLTLESYGNSEYKFDSKRDNRITIIVKVRGGRIFEIQNPTKFRFPYIIGEQMTQNILSWACNNQFLVNSKDPCPEKKVFGVKVSDIPQGHELRKIFPNKFR